MPYLTDLAAACRKSGLKVVEQPGWRQRGHGPMGSIKAIVCHHTAGPAAGNAPSLNVVQSGRTGLPGPLSQIVLARDGTVYVVAAGLAYHAGAVRKPEYGNAHAIGIEAEATGTTTWPERQMDAYARLCAALMAHYRVPLENVLGHKEVCSPAGRKIDPNFDMVAFRAQVQQVARRRTPGVTRFLNAKGRKQRRKIAQGLAKNGDTPAIRRTAKRWLNRDKRAQRWAKLRAQAFRTMRKHEVK